MQYCESFMKRYRGVYNYVTYIIGASLKKSYTNVMLPPNNFGGGTRKKCLTKIFCYPTVDAKKQTD